MFNGEWTEKNYAVSGDVLDGVSRFDLFWFAERSIFMMLMFQYFYDLLMNLLEEKGISNEFVTKLSTLSTNYEHATYVGLLESLSKFTLGGK